MTDTQLCALPMHARCHRSHASQIWYDRLPQLDVVSSSAIPYSVGLYDFPYLLMLAVVVSCSLALGSCANVKGATVQAAAETGRFHEQINSRQLDATHAVVKAKRATRPVRFMPIHASLAHLQYLRRYYQEQLGLDVELLPELVTDRAAWTAERRQWSAEGLAEQVRQSVGNDDAVVIGVTGEDIYLRRVNWRFAFGLRVGNRVAIVSYARMDPRFFREPENLDLLRRRLRRMVTKDLGLMLFDLEASPDPASPLYRDIGGIQELDAMGEDLARAGFPVVTR